MRMTIGKILHAINVVAVVGVIVLFIPVIIVSCVGGQAFESFMASIQIPLSYGTFKAIAYGCLGTTIVAYFLHEKFFEP